MNNAIASYYYEELREWDRALEFYEGEITDFEQKLTGLINRNTIPGLAANAEKFLARFNIQRSEFLLLWKEIDEQEMGIQEKDTLLLDEKQSSIIRTHQDTLRNKMKITEQRYVDLKYDCYCFLSGIYHAGSTL